MVPFRFYWPAAVAALQRWTMGRRNEEKSTMGVALSCYLLPLQGLGFGPII